MELDLYQCGVIDCFNEMVGVGLKKLAMAHPVGTRDERDAFLPFCETICARYHTKYYVEDDPLLTDLFPLSMNQETFNLIFYRDQTVLDGYLSLKDRKKKLVLQNSYQGEAREKLALDFGTLLSYPKEDCLRLIRENQEKEGGCG